MTPSSSSRVMRFFTVPRDTPSLCASVATVLRALPRSRPMSCWSRLSMQQSVSSRCQNVKKPRVLLHWRGFCLPWGLQTMDHMTLLLTPRDVALIVQAQGMAGALRRLVCCIEADFLRWNAFDKSARSASHSRDGVIELMPIADGALYSFKYVNGHPGNTRLGLPTVMAFGVLADVATGKPELLSELTLTTALRTAATSVLAARVMARPGSRTMALIGNGAQAEFQALAFHHLLGIHEIRLFDIDSAATAKLQRNL